MGIRGDYNTGVLIPSGYAGFDWSEFGYLDGDDYSNNPSGYQNGIVSPDDVAYNCAENPASITSAGPFTFNSAYFTGGWNNGLNIQVTGYLNGKLVDSKSFTVNASGPTLETFNWTDINVLDFASSGGTKDAQLNGGALRCERHKFRHGQFHVHRS